MPPPNNYLYVPTGSAGGTFGCEYNENSLFYCFLDGNVYLGEVALWQLYSWVTRRRSWCSPTRSATVSNTCAR